jgi:alcohol dehydrogenase/L-iditol 2-dehydrogenase
MHTLADRPGGRPGAGGGPSLRALIKYANQPDSVELRDVPAPVPGPGQVLIRVAAVGICGSDIEMWHQDASWPINVPVILGHEFSGSIAALGPGVEGWAVGDRVTCETHASVCGRCPACRQGLPNLCPSRLGYGYGTDGAFAEYVVAPERVLHRLPDGVSFEGAALTEPACVAYNGLVVNARLLPGEPALILGPGPIGLFALQMARICGSAPIVITGTSADAERLEAARRLGADVAVDTGETDVEALVAGLTGGYGVPTVVDCVGRAPTVAQSMRCVARGGQIVKIGWGPQPLDLSLDPIIQKAVRLQGTFSHTWRTWEAVLGLVGYRRLDMQAMISDVIPLERWREGFDLVASRRAVKVVVRP